MSTKYYLSRAAKPEEMEGHKYIDRIKTKSGNWRYIYEEAKGRTKAATQQVQQTANKAASKASQIPVSAKSVTSQTTARPKQAVQSVNQNALSQVKISKDTQNKLNQKIGATFTFDPNTGETVTDDPNAKKVKPVNQVTKQQVTKVDLSNVSDEYKQALGITDETKYTGKKEKNQNDEIKYTGKKEKRQVSDEYLQETGEAPKYTGKKEKRQNNTETAPKQTSKEYRQETGEEAPRQTSNNSNTRNNREGATFTLDKESGTTKREETSNRDTSSLKGIKKLVENFSNGLKNFLEGSSLPSKIVKAIMPDDIDNDIRRKLGVKDPGINDFSEDSEGTFQENRNLHTELKKKTEVTSRDEDMTAVNPKLDKDAFTKLEQSSKAYYEALEKGDREAANKAYKENVRTYAKNAGYMNNCVNCTLTYDLRRRGYDAEAPSNLSSGGTVDYIVSLYDMDKKDISSVTPNKGIPIYNPVFGTSQSTEPFSEKEASDMKKNMEDKYPEGAYGHIFVSWAQGGAHDMVWSKEEGEIIIRDCQSGEVKSLEEVMTKSTSASEFRADDKELSELAYDNAKTDNLDRYEGSFKNVYDTIHNALSKNSKKKNQNNVSRSSIDNSRLDYAYIY